MEASKNTRFYKFACYLQLPALLHGKHGYFSSSNFASSDTIPLSL